MPQAIEDIRRKVITATSGKAIERLKVLATKAGHPDAQVCVKFITAKQTAENCGTREVIADVSADTPDLDDDVILQDGWDFSYFDKHLLCMPFHDYWTYPNGTCLWRKVIKTESGGHVLRVKTRYATRPESFPREQEWVPDTVLDLRKQKVMKGYSVGFIVLEERSPTEKEIKKHADWDGKRVLARNLLLEYSDVPLPCNGDAVQIMVAKGLLPATEEEGVEPDGQVEAETKSVEPAAGDADGAGGGTVDSERSDPAAGDGDAAPDAGDTADVRVDTAPAEADGGGGADSGAVAGVEPAAVEQKAEPVDVEVVVEPAKPNPGEIAHLLVLAEIAAGKYVRVDPEAIRAALIEDAVKDRLAFHRGALD